MSDKEREDPPLRVVDRRWSARGESEQRVEDTGARKPTRIEELEQQLADRSAEIHTYQIETRRALDEFEQAKARIRRDVGKAVERERRAVLAELLDVVDNLDRAIASARDASGDRALLQGVELVRDQFLAKLRAFGVTRLSALGERFDATRHEAVTNAPIADPGQDGTVVAVLKEGYAIGDDILRPASVVVGQS